MSFGYKRIFWLHYLSYPHHIFVMTCVSVSSWTLDRSSSGHSRFTIRDYHYQVGVTAQWVGGKAIVKGEDDWFRISHLKLIV